MTPTRTLGALRPMEAYRALSRFEGRRGPAAMRLAMHAAVPQSFRPDLLHLLKLNFVPEAADDPAVEADVLLAPFSDDLGGGYFQFDPEVRRLLLDELADTYADEPVHRVLRVADFLLAYVERAERRAPALHDRLGREFLETQRWVALAFARPDAAAEQLAAALQAAEQAPALEARLHLGGLAHAVAIPLAHHRQLLDYALALHALETGDRGGATDLLEPLQREFTVGSITLAPGRVMPPRRPAASELGGSATATPSDAVEALLSETEPAAMAEASERAQNARPRRVFISGTVHFLYRQAAVNVCFRLGLIPVVVEGSLTADGPSAPLHLTLEHLGTADVYVCMLGGRYGYAPPGEDRSLVEIEYDYAIASGISVFCFLGDDEMIASYGHQVRLNAFREKILNSGAASSVSSVNDFSAKLNAALLTWKSALPAPDSVAPEQPSVNKPASAKSLRKLFFWYDRRELVFTRRLYTDLRAAGFEIWMDEIAHESPWTNWDAMVRDALRACDALVLVLTSETFVRDPLFIEAATGKPVFQVFRAGVFPDDLPREFASQPAFDFRPRRVHETALDELLRSLRAPRGDEPVLGRLYGVPPLPAGLITREQDFTELRRLVLAKDSSITVLVGPGGAGKTVMASALAHDEVVRRRFPDGIVWATMNPHADVEQVLEALSRLLGEDVPAASALFGRNRLLVLDDVEDAGTVRYLAIQVDPKGHVLVISRQPNFASRLGARSLLLGGVSPSEAMQLLAGHLGVSADQLSPEAQEVAAAVRLQPARLIRVADLVRKGASWSDLLQRLRSEGPRALEEDVAAASTGEPFGEMPEGAVYICYAPEDRAAAERLAGALKQVTDVWLDRGLLFSGDDWDLAIRRNINRCSLFVVVLSRKAAARAEGYFRREWSLALGRRDRMAAELPFIIPVIIDDLPVRAEGIPQAFWNVRPAVVPRGEATEEFLTSIRSQVRRVRSAFRSHGLTDPDLRAAGLSRRLGEHIVRDKDVHDLSGNSAVANFSFFAYHVTPTAVEMVALCDADGLTEPEIVRLRDEFFELVRTLPNQYGLRPRGKNPNGLLGFVFARGCPPDMARFISRQTRVSHETGTGGIAVSWAIDAAEGRIHPHANPVSDFPPVIVAPQSVFPGLQYLESLLSQPSPAAAEIQEPGTTGLSWPTADDIRILFISASSAPNQFIGLDRELRTLITTLNLSRSRDRMVFGTARAMTIAELRQGILHHRPDILHVSGDGGKVAGIMLQSKSGRKNVVAGKVLESVFEPFRDTVKCVVLSSCWSKSQAEAIRRQIPYVVGSRAGIPESTAMAFFSGFYRAIAARRDVPFAFREGQARVQMQREENADLLMML